MPVDVSSRGHGRRVPGSRRPRRKAPASGNRYFQRLATPPRRNPPRRHPPRAPYAGRGSIEHQRAHRPAPSRQNVKARRRIVRARPKPRPGAGLQTGRGVRRPIERQSRVVREAFPTLGSPRAAPYSMLDRLGRKGSRPAYATPRHVRRADRQTRAFHREFVKAPPGRRFQDSQTGRLITPARGGYVRRARVTKLGGEPVSFTKADHSLLSRVAGAGLRTAGDIGRVLSAPARFQAELGGRGLRAASREVPSVAELDRALRNVRLPSQAGSRSRVAGLPIASTVPPGGRPKVVKAGSTFGGRVVSDALNIGAQAVPSIYQLGAATYEAAGGNTKRAERLWSDYKKTGVIPAAAQGKLGEAVKRLAEHPLAGSLELSGGKAV